LAYHVTCPQAQRCRPALPSNEQRCECACFAFRANVARGARHYTVKLPVRLNGGENVETASARPRCSDEREITL
jgi:hypothetical protein